jgi:hypothetical protein
MPPIDGGKLTPPIFARGSAQMLISLSPAPVVHTSICCADALIEIVSLERRSTDEQLFQDNHFHEENGTYHFTLDNKYSKLTPKTAYLVLESNNVVISQAEHRAIHKFRSQHNSEDFNRAMDASVQEEKFENEILKLKGAVSQMKEALSASTAKVATMATTLESANAGTADQRKRNARKIADMETELAEAKARVVELLNMSHFHACAEQRRSVVNGKGGNKVEVAHGYTWQNHLDVAGPSTVKWALCTDDYDIKIGLTFTPSAVES